MSENEVMVHLRQGMKLLGALSLVIGVALIGCNGDGVAERASDGSTLEIPWPASLGSLQRPLVAFPHGKHVAALAKEGCVACHPKGEDGRPVFTFQRRPDPLTRDALMELYHQRCLDCHATKSVELKRNLPVTCAECHGSHPGVAAERLAMRMDYSLHARHVIAHQDKCDGCHHVYDEQAKKLVYAKGKESACTDCHGAERVERTPALRNAAHDACVTCHLGGEEKNQKTGPSRCAGCHGAEERATIKKLDPIPRLMRGQPDRTWIQAAGGKAGRVPFDHQLHEPLTESCSTCHHQTLAACDKCHTLTGSPDGGGVTLANAFHEPTSDRSCVGCHRQTTDVPACAGCHAAMPPPPAEQSCATCHSGGLPPALPEGTDPTANIPTPSPSPELSPTPELSPSPSLSLSPSPSPSPEPTLSPEPPPPPSPPVTRAPLPPFSEAFPETVVINLLARDYQPSKLPHGKIVATLDRKARENKLAGAFHTDTTLCAGCHHHSPPATRPPACRSCHGAKAHPTRDQPSLKAAYHRQCIGCHESMSIKKTGCIDCHAEAVPKAPKEEKR